MLWFGLRNLISVVVDLIEVLRLPIRLHRCFEATPLHDRHITHLKNVVLMR